MKEGQTNEQELVKDLLKLMIKIDELMLQIIEQQPTRLVEKAKQVH